MNPMWMIGDSFLTRGGLHYFVGSQDMEVIAVDHQRYDSNYRFGMLTLPSSMNSFKWIDMQCAHDCGPGRAVLDGVFYVAGGKGEGRMEKFDEMANLTKEDDDQADHDERDGHDKGKLSPLLNCF